MDIEPGTVTFYALAVLAGTLMAMGSAGFIGALVGHLVLTLGYEVDPWRWSVIAAVALSVATFVVGSVISYRDYHFDPDFKG